MKNHPLRRCLSRYLWLPAAALLAACGGGSDSGAGAKPGSTPFTGVWTLAATLNVFVGGTSTSIMDSSEVVVGNQGNVLIRETDSQCALDITVNGNRMVYETTCSFAVTNEDISTSCTLTMVARATIRGTPGSGAVSAPFGPETLACRGLAASYTGNLIGSQGSADDGDTDTDTDSESGTENGDET